jgi:heat-inducible transcriptional repressor
VQLVAISPRVVLVVVVTSAGAVLKRSMELAEDLHEEVLSRASGVLNDEIKDSRISSIPFPAPTGLTAVDELVGAGRAAVEAMFDDGARTVYVEGASNIAGAFDVTSTLQEILRLLEQQIAVVTLLNDVIDRGLTVAIGSETGMESLSECSLVVAPYLVGNEPVGTIGVLGPTRMNYQETIAAVAVVAQRLSRLLTQG